MTLIRVFSLAAAAALVACSTTAPADDDGWTRVPGIIDNAVSSVPLLMLDPQPVRAGQAVRASIATWGLPGCSKAGDTQLRISGDVITITPWNYHAPRGSACAQGYQRLEHEITLLLPRAGTATVRIAGRDWRGRNVTLPVAVQVAP